MKTEKIMIKNKQLLCYFLLFFICVGNNSISYAQGWIKYFDNNHYNIPAYDQGITTITLTSDGGHIFSSRSNNTLLNLTKVDQDGLVQWDSSYLEPHPTLESPSVQEIIELQDGYVFCGYYLQSPGVGLTPYLMKVDKFGGFLWEKTYNFEAYFGYYQNHLVATLDGGFLFASIQENNDSTVVVVKTNNIGDIEWQRAISFAEDILKIIPNSTNTFDILVQEPFVPANQNPDSEVSIYKMDIQGNMLDTIYINSDPLNPDTYISDVVKEPNGDYVFVGKISGPWRLCIYKTDSIGNLKWKKDYSQIPITVYDDSKIIKADNGYVISTYYLFSSQGPSEATAVKVDDTGNLLWKKVFPGMFRDVAKTIDNSYVFVGYSNPFAIGLKTVHLVKLDDNGHIYDNYLAGNVFIDQNLNCTIDPSEPGLNKWLLEAEGNQTFYALTDSLGNYKMDVDTGTYDLRMATQGPLWNSCTPTTTTIQVNTNDSILTDFPFQAIYDCPYLTIDISTPFLRRCFDNYYTVSYCNQGTVPSSNTDIEIEFHPHLDVTSSSIPWTNQTGNTFTFPVGNLNINECGSFLVTVTPNCDSTILGQTLCVYATILPDSICTPPTSSWDGSITDLDVSCGIDSVTFTIINVGNGNMATQLEYFVIEDNLIDKQGLFQLDAMESMELKFPANGSTYRLYAKQSPGYFPLGYYPTIAYEGCGVDSSGTFSMGYINVFPENNVLNTETVDCQELIGSFDPNDKQAAPKGYGPEHYIEVGDDLEYKIRFQNTGSDTAFTVVIRDTISSDLDIATLLPGTSSHPYQLDIINGNTLKFTFSNILLVDSLTNEPASHGFVKFKICQQPNLPLGTTIYNSAAIYFDFNEPVITNETFHEIGEDFIPVILSSNEPAPEYPKVNIRVQPNPFVNYVEFLLENAPSGKKTFELYDATGKLLLKDTFSKDSSYLLHKQGLLTGIYFYKILNNNKLLTSGKLIAGN